MSRENLLSCTLNPIIIAGRVEALECNEVSGHSRKADGMNQHLPEKRRLLVDCRPTCNPIAAGLRENPEDLPLPNGVVDLDWVDRHWAGYLNKSTAAQGPYQSQKLQSPAGRRHHPRRCGTCKVSGTVGPGVDYRVLELGG